MDINSKEDAANELNEDVCYGEHEIFFKNAFFENFDEDIHRV